MLCVSYGVVTEGGGPMVSRLVDLHNYAFGVTKRSSRVERAKKVGAHKPTKIPNRSPWAMSGSLDMNQMAMDDITERKPQMKHTLLRIRQLAKDIINSLELPSVDTSSKTFSDDTRRPTARCIKAIARLKLLRACRSRRLSGDPDSDIVWRLFLFQSLAFTTVDEIA